MIEWIEKNGNLYNENRNAVLRNHVEYAVIDVFRFMVSSVGEGSWWLFIEIKQIIGKNDGFKCINSRSFQDKKKAKSVAEKWLEERKEALRGTCEWENERFEIEEYGEGGVWYTRVITTSCSGSLRMDNIPMKNYKFCPYCGGRIVRKES